MYSTPKISIFWEFWFNSNLHNNLVGSFLSKQISCWFLLFDELPETSKYPWGIDLTILDVPILIVLPFPKVLFKLKV